MNIALQVHVDTYRGTLEGVPALLDLFQRLDTNATFLFSLGPDHTGRALRRIFRPGFLAKVRRTSVTSHYGFKTLMYGTLLPGPHIGRRAGHVMRAVRDAGHEVGIHCYDHVKWQDFVAIKDGKWTEREMRRAEEAFVTALETNPSTFGAAGWQINPETLAIEEKMGFPYTTDTRGTEPFFPVMEGVESRCIQIPTTLPTLDELIGCNGITEDNVVETVFEASRKVLPHGHVYTLHAELEGQKLLPVFTRLIERWQGAGDTMMSLNTLYKTLDIQQLPRKTITRGAIEGRSGTLAVESGTL